jgi:serine/threonine protein kinase
MPEGKGDMDDAYEMSGHVGTLRYMSGEVSKGEAYNQSADVYSFALLLHEIMSLEKPFANMTRGQHKEQVAKRGLRPKINRSWSRPIQDIIERGWSANFNARPTMKEIHQVLREEICNVNDWELDSDLVQIPTRRRSTFVLEPAGLPSRKSILCTEITPEELALIKEATKMLMEARQTSLTTATPTNKISLVSRAA